MIIKMIIGIAAYLLLAPAAGGLLSGLDRKLSARMQGRKGSSVKQPFYDVMKLMAKEQQTSSKIGDFFVIMFTVFTVASGVVFFGGGDMLLTVFLLVAADVFLILAAGASRSPYSAAGAQRELVQMMGYVPLLLMTAIGFYLSDGSFAVRDIMMGSFMSFIHLIGIFIGFMIVMAVKLRKSPFDLSMSYGGYQDMMNGIVSGFSGRTLAAVEICRWYEMILLFGFVFLFFANGTAWGAAAGAVVCIAVYFLEILADGSFARVKSRTMLKVLWASALIFGLVNIFIVYLTV